MWADLTSVHEDSALFFYIWGPHLRIQVSGKINSHIVLNFHVLMSDFMAHLLPLFKTSMNFANFASFAPEMNDVCFCMGDELINRDSFQRFLRKIHCSVN